VERKYRVNWGELLMGRYRCRVSTEYSADILLWFGFCCVVTFGLVKHRMRDFKDKSRRGLLDGNKSKVREIFVIEYRKFYI
jgi:hypothetical protein